MPDKDNWGTPRPRRRWGRWIFAVLLLLLIGLFTAHAIWSWSAQRALAKLVAGYRAAGEPTTPAELENAYVPDAENAVIEIRAAMAVLHESSDTMKRFDYVGFSFPRTAKEQVAVEAALRENAAVFPLMEAAMAKSGFDWKIRITTPVILIRLPDLTFSRQLANFLGAAALAAHEDGDDAAAVRLVREILFLSRAVDRQPPLLVTHLVAIGIRAFACHCAEEIAPDLAVVGGATTARQPVTRGQLQLLLDELVNETESRAAFRRTMLGERVQSLDCINAILSGKMSQADTAGAGPPASAGFSPRLYFMTPILVGQAQVWARVTTVFAGVVEDKNFAAALARTTPLSDELDHRRTPTLAGLLTPSYSRSVHTYYRSLTESRLAALSLALRAYAVDHDGRLPDSLTSLVAAYLPAVPLDPFAGDDSAMRYLPAEPDPRVYSVGANGMDDGGSDRPVRAGRGVNDPADLVLHIHRQPRDPTSVMKEMED